jgi:hypothetical protein
MRLPEWPIIENRIGILKPPKKRNLRHIHHSPIFWVGVALCLAAIMLYVMSEDLSRRL